MMERSSISNRRSYGLLILTSMKAPSPESADLNKYSDLDVSANSIVLRMEAEIFKKTTVDSSYTYYKLKSGTADT
jgi:hypothetical protein